MAHKELLTCYFISVDHCKDTTLTCQNDGICYNDPSIERGYGCFCEPFFYGDDCQIRKFTA